MSDSISPSIQFFHFLVSNLITTAQGVQSRPKQNAKPSEIVADVARTGIPPVKIAAK